MNSERYRLVFSGSGGQGVITASIILGEAAVFHEGWNAVQTQSYGPEARGGTARADLILSPEPINFPKVAQPNILVCLTQEAYDRWHAGSPTSSERKKNCSRSPNWNRSGSWPGGSPMTSTTS